MKKPNFISQWREQESADFIDFGNYFVPEREYQMQVICDVIEPLEGEFHILDLCCGEGLLAGVLLAGHPTAVVHGYDGSDVMLQKAQSNLADFGPRFKSRKFDLAAFDWRRPEMPVQAVVSSLAIHHLDGPEKQILFKNVFEMLNPGGVFYIADLILPAAKCGEEIAARAWDDAVKQRALEIDGSDSAFEYFKKEQWNLYRFPDPIDKPSSMADQLNWLSKVGFLAVDVLWMKAGHAIFGGKKPDVT